MEKIGFYGGTFDPIHFGHLFLAIQLAELHQLDLVLVCPSFCSPFKIDQKPMASGSERLQMVRLALEGMPRFEALPSEIERKGVSYTIDTIRALPPAQYHLLLSEESALQFSGWKDAEELIRLAPPLIGCRSGAFRASSREENAFSLPPFFNQGFTMTKSMEISSTDIRQRLQKKLYCGHLVPAKALDYINQNRLYSC